MLSAQGKKAKVGQPPDLTFVTWLQKNSKKLGSVPTVYRLLKKYAGLEAAKHFKVGDRVQRKDDPVCVVTGFHSVEENGAQTINVRFEGDNEDRQILASTLHKFKAPEVEQDGLIRYKGAEYKCDGLVDGNVTTHLKFSRTSTPTDAEVEKAEKVAAAEEKERVDAAAKVKADADKVIADEDQAYIMSLDKNAPEHAAAKARADKKHKAAQISAGGTAAKRTDPLPPVSPDSNDAKRPPTHGELT